MNDLNSVLIEGRVSDIQVGIDSGCQMEIDTYHTNDERVNRFVVNVRPGTLAQYCHEHVILNNLVRIVGRLKGSAFLGFASIEAEYIEGKLTKSPTQKYCVGIQVNYTCNVVAENEAAASELAAAEVVDNGDGIYESYEITSINPLP